MSRPINTIRDVATAVRGRRKELGLSQDDVARRAGVSRQWVNEFESGKPTAELQLVLRLIDALSLSLRLDDGTDHDAARGEAQRVDLDSLLDSYRRQ